jgi:hypothetical protein
MRSSKNVKMKSTVSTKGRERIGGEEDYGYTEANRKRRRLLKRRGRRRKRS